jgi:hypothetical protein
MGGLQKTVPMLPDRTLWLAMPSVPMVMAEWFFPEWLGEKWENVTLE